MHRLQTIVLVVWVVFVLLLALFNWSLLWRVEPVEFLFVEFELSLFLWFALLGVGVAAALRAMSWSEARAAAKRLGREIDRLKAQAFDERSGELDNLATRIQEKVEEALKTIVAARNDPPPAPEKSDGAEK